MKITSFLIYTLPAILAIGSGACSNTQNCLNATDTSVEKTRSVQSFQSVDINVPAEITLKQSGSNSVTITAAANILEHIQTDIRKNNLQISLDKEVCRPGKIRILISGKTFNKINASGKSTIRSTGRLKATELALNLSGAIGVTLDLEAEKLQTNASGANEIILTGSVNKHSLSISGEGKIIDNTIEQ